MQTHHDPARLDRATGRSGPGLAAHAAGLAVLLLVLMPVVGWHGVFSSDEGAAIAAAKQLSEHGSVAVDHAFAAADPTGAAFPFEKSVPVDEGFAPLPKRPLYILLLAGADRIGGVAAMVGLSLAGAVGAATVSALVARRLHPSLDVPTLWLTGLASPLLVDGFLIIAHAVAAALTAGTLLAALRTVENVTVRRAIPVVPLLAAATMLRAEATLFGLALSVAVGVLFLVRRHRGYAYAGGAALAGLLTGTVGDHLLTGELIGDAAPVSTAASEATAGDSFLSERLEGLLETLFRPGYGDLGVASVLLVTILVVGLWGVLELQRDRPDRGAVRIIAGAVIVAGTALFGQIVTADPQIIPGLLLAFPIGIWGLVAVDRSTLRHMPPQLLGLTAIIFAAAVVAAQYPQGGAWEWGWRYFAIGLPALTPLVAAGLLRLRSQLDPPTTPIAVFALVVASLAPAVMGLASVAHLRDLWSDFTSRVVAEANMTVPGDGGRPVIVSTEPELPRAAWQSMDDHRWLLVAEADLPDMLGRLDDLGIEELVLATKGPSAEQHLVDGPYLITDGPAPATTDLWWVPTLHRR